MKLLLFPFGIPVGKLPHRKEVRTAFHGWRLRSKRVDPTPQEMRTAFHGWRLRSKRVDPTPQEMRTAFHGWRLRSKRVDSLFPKPFRVLKITQNHFSHN